MLNDEESYSIIEMENKLSNLEKENFDLKMRIHYMSLKPSNYADSPTDSSVSSPYPDTISLLRGTSESSSFVPKEQYEIVLQEKVEFEKKIIELESTLLQLQLQRDRELSQYQQNLLTLKASSSSSNSLLIQQTEENRKKEREATQTIVEHDTILIHQLRQQIEILEKERDSDRVKLTSALMNFEELSEKYNQVEAKNTEMNFLLQELREENQRISQENQILMKELEVGKGRGGVISTQTTQNTSLTTSPALSPSTSAVSASSPSFTSEQEIKNLQEENSILKEKQQKLQASIQSQTVIITTLREKMNDLYALEVKDIQNLKQSIRLLESDKQSLSTALHEAHQEINLHQQKIRQQLALAIETNEDLAPGGGGGGLGGTMGSRTNSLSFPSSYSPLTDTEYNMKIQKYEATIELFRKREVELMAALEGVVRRCQELESQQQSHLLINCK